MSWIRRLIFWLILAAEIHPLIPCRFTWISAVGSLRSLKIGKRWLLIRVEALKAWIAAHEVEEVATMYVKADAVDGGCGQGCALRRPARRRTAAGLTDVGSKKARLAACREKLATKGPRRHPAI